MTAEVSASHGATRVPCGERSARALERFQTVDARAPSRAQTSAESRPHLNVSVERENPEEARRRPRPGLCTAPAPAAVTARAALVMRPRRARRRSLFARCVRACPRRVVATRSRLSAGGDEATWIRDARRRRAPRPSRSPPPPTRATATDAALSAPSHPRHGRHHAPRSRRRRPEIVGGQEFLIAPGRRRLRSLDDVDESLPATRSCVESDGPPPPPTASRTKSRSGRRRSSPGTPCGGSLALQYFRRRLFPSSVRPLFVSYALLLSSALILVEPTVRVWEDKPGKAVDALGGGGVPRRGVSWRGCWLLINCTLVPAGQVRRARGGQRGGREARGVVREARQWCHVHASAFNHGVGRSARWRRQALRVLRRRVRGGRFGISTNSSSRVICRRGAGRHHADDDVRRGDPHGGGHVPGKPREVRLVSLGSLGPAVMYALWLASTPGEDPSPSTRPGGDRGKDPRGWGCVGHGDGAHRHVRPCRRSSGVTSRCRFNADHLRCGIGVHETRGAPLSAGVDEGTGVVLSDDQVRGDGARGVCLGGDAAVGDVDHARGGGKLTALWKIVLAGRLGFVAMALGARAM